MSKLSNTALQAENDVLRREAAEYEATIGEAAVTINDLIAKLEAAKRQIAELEAIKGVAGHAKPKAARPPVVIPQAELDRRARVAERMAKAKALAMSIGEPVLA